MTLLSIWNACRQSGDHGPINSWDRMPFLTDIATGGVGPATYAAALSETSHSMIIANYGASQGFDNDDGSSWCVPSPLLSQPARIRAAPCSPRLSPSLSFLRYDTHDNFFYDADGFKMDYGGHDSKFHNNVVIAVHGQNCVGTASFIAGHATSLYENDCVVYGTERVDDLFENCDKDLAPQVPMNGYNNRFYTPLANASATCDCCGTVSLAQLQAINPTLEANATSSGLPSADTVVAWARDKLQLPAAAAPAAAAAAA